jgi:hypothetical protein
VSHNCSSVGSPAVTLVKGKLSVEGFEGCEACVSTTMPCGSEIVDHPPGAHVLKVCYFRYWLWFAEIDPVLKFNTGILGIRCLARLCVNLKQHLLEGLH